MTALMEGISEAVRAQGWAAVATRWGLTLGLVFVSWAVLGITKTIVVSRLRRLGEHRRLAPLARFGDIADRTNAALYTAVALVVGRVVFPFTETSAKTIAGIATVLLFLQLGFWLTEGVRVGVERYSESLEDPKESQAALAFLAFAGRVIVWGVVVLLVLENVGFDVTTLIAGLGVGGIAIALAAQNILGDLFASLSLIVDKPFVPGDFIIVDDLMGTVEHIGLKTTRIRSLGGEQLIFSNADLLSTRVRNYQRLEERRVNFQFGIVYQTSTDCVEEVPDIVRDIIEQTDRVRFDRAHLKDFGESAFKYEVIYWILDPDYTVYMDLQQQILLQILEAFRERGIELAYPTRTVHLDGGESSVGSAGR